MDFNQGMDARFIIPEGAKMRANMHWIQFTRLAYDTSGMLPVVRQTVAYLKGSGISPSRFWAYALVQEMRRVLTEIWARNWKISRTSSEGFRGEVCSYSFFSICW